MNDNYRTKDLGISAVLLTLGFKLIKTDWNGKEVFFLFDEKKKALEVAHQYNFGGIKVTAKLYHDNLVLIKREILAKYNPNRFKKDIRTYATVN